MGRAYDNPVIAVYTFEGHDFGAGDATKRIKAPKGMRARVEDIQADASETFTNVTTEAKVQVGVTGELDKLADYGLGTLAAGAADAASYQDGDLKPDALETEDETVLITLKAPTGGTPAGIADVHVVMAWHV